MEEARLKYSYCILNCAFIFRWHIQMAYSNACSYRIQLAYFILHSTYSYSYGIFHVHIHIAYYIFMIMFFCTWVDLHGRTTDNIPVASSIPP
jgi:hypothetical protein